MREINLDEWVLSGEGAQGQSYNHKNDKSLMLKLYTEAWNADVEKEHRIAQTVAQLGISTPKPGELVSCGKRKGMIFERIAGKRSYSRMISEDNSRLEELSIRFAELCRQLHETPVSITDGLEDYRDKGKKLFSSDKVSEKTRKKVCSFLDRQKAPECYCHGDMHIGNIINDGKKDYFIDLGDFCLANTDFDLGGMYFILKYSPAIATRKTLHLPLKLCYRIWDVFYEHYYPNEADRRQHIDAIRKYAVYRMLCLCANGHTPFLFVALMSHHLRECLRIYRNEIR